jgi:DNA repair exonuclease SbcCD ATPase subunit
MFDTIYRTFDSEITYIQNEVVGLESQLESLTKSRVMTDELETLTNENERISAKVTEFKEKKSELTDALAKLNGYTGEFTTKISNNRQKIQKLIDFYKSGICHTCGRPFDEDTQKQKIKEEIEQKRVDTLECDDKLKRLNARITQIRESIKKLESNIWTLVDRAKDNEKKLVNNDAKIETLRTLAQQKRKLLDDVEEKILGFKRRYEMIFSQEEINAYVRNKIQSFEQVYQEIYNTLTQQSVDVRLNINKYEEPEFGDFFYSGLSTSKKRLTYLVMMLALHEFCDTKLNFLILDEFFDVFDFENMVKILETIFSTPSFKNLQFIITSNNDDLIGLIKDDKINLINLIDYTKN